MVRSTWYYIVYYAAMTVIVLIAVYAVSWAFDRFAPGLLGAATDPGLSGFGVVAVMLPPLLTAQRYYAAEQQVLERWRGWRWSVVFALVWSVFQIAAVAFAIGAQFGVDQARSFAASLGDDMATAAAIGAGAFVMIVLVNKVMLWTGFRSAIKQAEKRARNDPAG